MAQIIFFFVCNITDMSITKFVQMMILGWAWHCKTLYSLVTLYQRALQDLMFLLYLNGGERMCLNVWSVLSAMLLVIYFQKFVYNHSSSRVEIHKLLQKGN